VLGTSRIEEALEMLDDDLVEKGLLRAVLSVAVL
jgi:hypothetical protein